MQKEILEYLGADWDRVQNLIHGALYSDIDLLNTTNDNLLSHSGKMLRPVLTLLMAKAVGGNATECSCRYAAATELLHNATLLHDDVADESLERRGVPTVNATLGANAAVLVGDFWLARAVEMVLASKDDHDNVVNLFSKTLVDLAEGEMLQLEKASSADTQDKDYFRIIGCKTASLFEAACESAAVSVNAPDEYRQAARAYAHAAGVAFQIKDDILDYAGNAQLGKPLGIDLKEQKITLPLLCAMQGSPREAEIRGMIRDIHDHPEYCDEVRAFVEERGGVEMAAARLDGFIEQAERSLDVLPDSKARTFLVELVRFNAFRNV
ncbi:MAG: polyprenyl synthetase family protein [Bacteroidales bacterium]|nr:polyprenyl synthetase family protein [Bacteroidales bacterium]